jgi:PIN domain nuclease of toxin-antitoxin system
LRLLLDTHAFLWAVESPDLLGRRAAQEIADPENTVFVSAATAWEMATKVRLGKWPEATATESDFLAVIEDANYVLLPISVDIALRAGRLVGEHRDPFDRILAAHALAEDIPILSADAKLDGFGVRRIW